MSYRKKLIEVALPLDAINKEATRENYIYKGNPSSIHKWWAQRPLAVCRAVLFASLIDDPSSRSEEFLTEEDQNQERKRLFNLIEELVIWENSNNEEVLAKVHSEILKSTNGNPPPIFDPFAGGGSIPLEAQRLDLEAHASDLNPVAVLINKALIEIPPKFINRPPVHPGRHQLFENQNNDWKGAHGLVNDILYYGKWMRDEAEKRIGHLYPKVTLPKEHGGDAMTIAWLWARTVKCPNPACGTQMPLVRSFQLSKKKDREAWAEPIVNHTTTLPTISFVIRTDSDKLQDGTVNRRGAKCIVCGASVPFDHIRSEGQAGRMGTQLLAIVAKGSNGRVYLAPTQEHVAVAEQVVPSWSPEVALPHNPRDFKTPNYGMTTFGDLFTSRQLLALTTFSDLIQEVHQRVLADASTANLPNDAQPLHAGGCGALAYADAVATYLAFACDKYAVYGCALAPWYPKEDRPKMLFANQAIPMVWDFVEVNPFTEIGGSIVQSIAIVADSVLSVLSVSKRTSGFVSQRDAATATVDLMNPVVVSTDPPYYDNIGYADLSDFFYVWLRRSLSGIYPELFGTMLVPKAQELIAAPYRSGGNKRHAQEFFETGLGKAFEHMRTIQHQDYPLTVYYAFKQSESEVEEDVEDKIKKNSNSKMTASTGWETMLEGLINSGFSITGTWPMRTEREGRSIGNGANALASSIVLVCRPRPIEAPIATRGEFLRALRKELPEALRKLQHGSIAPVDLAQASIGPGMSIYSRNSQVVESDGTPLRVRTALQMINQELDAALAEQEGEYDRETRWAIAWFEQYGMQEGEYGVAETLSKAKDMSVARLEHTGLVVSKAGKVRLKRREELPREWTAPNSTVWEVAQRMIYALLEGKGEMGGEIGTANILRQALSLSESVRDLLYRLYTVCDRKGWTQEALAYNGLVTSWTRITDLAHRRPTAMQQATLL